MSDVLSNIRGPFHGQKMWGQSSPADEQRPSNGISVKEVGHEVGRVKRNQLQELNTLTVALCSPPIKVAEARRDLHEAKCAFDDTFQNLSNRRCAETSNDRQSPKTQI